jgi:hypothetical protein
MMKSLKNSLLTLVIVYSFASGQVAAADQVDRGESGSSSQTKQRSTSVQNEGLTLKQQAIKFYARNYRVINFVGVVMPSVAFAYGVSSLANYAYESQQQQIAMYKEQREVYHNICMLAAKECNGSWIPWDTCLAQLQQSTSFNVLIDCVSRLCGWNLLFAPNNDTRSSQLLVNTNINICSK